MQGNHFSYKADINVGRVEYNEDEMNTLKLLKKDL